jgi:hypothetical protein
MLPAPQPVVEAWVLRLPRANADALAPLRLHAGLELGEDGDALWLRGKRADDALRLALRGLPALERFDWLPDQRLRPAGDWLAARTMPDLRWTPLAEWLRPALPSARFPADAPPPVLLELVASTRERAANALLLPLDRWLEWALTAPELRLAQLRFAASADGRCLVLGAPLPPLPGRACVEDHGIVVPAGLAWRPAVPASLVRKVVGAPDDALVWWDETGARVLGAELFVSASRAAVRATRQTREARP